MKHYIQTKQGAPNCLHSMGESTLIVQDLLVTLLKLRFFCGASNNTWKATSLSNGCRPERLLRQTHLSSCDAVLPPNGRAPAVKRHRMPQLLLILVLVAPDSQALPYTRNGFGCAPSGRRRKPENRAARPLNSPSLLCRCGAPGHTRPTAPQIAVACWASPRAACDNAWDNTRSGDRSL